MRFPARQDFAPPEISELYFKRPRGGFDLFFCVFFETAWISKKATRESFGIVSLSNSSRLPDKSGETVLSPVMFPPGRARLATNPRPTGSPTVVVTIRMVLVACLAAGSDFPLW